MQRKTGAAVAVALVTGEVRDDATDGISGQEATAAAVPMIVVARGVGHRIGNLFSDHYSLLRTIEENFRLPLLGNAGDGVQVQSLFPAALTLLTGAREAGSP